MWSYMSIILSRSLSPNLTTMLLLQIKRNPTSQNLEKIYLLIQIVMKHCGEDVIKNLQRAEGRRSERDIVYLNQIAHQTQTANLQIVILILILHLLRHHRQMSVAQVMTGIGRERSTQRGIDTDVQKGKGIGDARKDAEGVTENQRADPRGSFTVPWNFSLTHSEFHVQWRLINFNVFVIMFFNFISFSS